MIKMKSEKSITLEGYFVRNDVLGLGCLIRIEIAALNSITF